MVSLNENLCGSCERYIMTLLQPSTLYSQAMNIMAVCEVGTWVGKEILCGRQ